MSKEKVERYKKEKAGRKLSLKKEKRLKTAVACICIAAAIIGAGFGGYYYGNKEGYNKGYTEAFSLAAQIYSSAAASGGAISSGAAVTTDNVSDSAVKTENKSGK